MREGGFVCSFIVRSSLFKKGRRMALWMEKGSEPLTEKEKADLDAIAALKQSAAIELKVYFSFPFPLYSL